MGLGVLCRKLRFKSGMGQWEGKVQTFAYPLFQRITLVPAELKHATDKFKNTL
jgi:hypothetical protein